MFAATKTASVSAGGYQISRSLRFNQPDSTYLNRTLTTPTNNTTWSWSGWVKLGQLGTTRQLFGGAGANYGSFGFETTDQFRFWNNAGAAAATSTAVYRDPSAWYHVVVISNGTTIKAYVNNSEVLSYTGTITNINSAITHHIGRFGSLSYYYDGYMTEVNFIDGQALTPSSFGETNAQTGVWQPKAYSGSYGTNGFYLNFSDNSNTTAATLGKDYSGNGNNWTPNNFSVTAGAGNDSLVDSPTSYGSGNTGGDVRGNFPTLNPLQISTTWATISNGNLQYVDTTVGGSYRAAYSTMFATSGKYYFEATCTAVSGTPYPTVGLVSPPPQNDTYIEQTITGYQGYGYYATGDKSTNDTYTAFGATHTAGDTVSVAVDIDAGKVWFAKNGSWQASGDPAAGTNPAFNIVTGRAYGFAVGNGSSASSIQMDANFGQRPFAYTPPSGFLALCAQNLPTPTIGATSTTQAGKYFNTILWTGNGSNPRSITGVGFQPDLSWLARRDVGYGLWLYDAVRGATKALKSNTTDVESTYQQLNSFDSDGFTQAGSNDQGNNINGGTYVAWNWKANGSGSTNTAGSITSTVSANTTSGFSIATYTGNGTSLSTVGHGLGAVPSMIVVKARSASGLSWYVYQKDVGNTKFLELNTSSATTTFNLWESTNPTSSVFTISNNAAINGSGTTFVAYCFAPVAGYSAFGSYTGNGSNDGPFVYTGMRPRFIMIKNITNSYSGYSGWYMVDTSREPYNIMSGTIPVMWANTSGAEGTRGNGSGTDIYNYVDILSNGFKSKIPSGVGGSAETNTSGDTYIFAAFAEFPFKYSLAR